MAGEDQRAAWEAHVARGDSRAAERGESSNDSRHEQMDSCICSEGIRFLEAPWEGDSGLLLEPEPPAVRPVAFLPTAGRWCPWPVDRGLVRVVTRLPPGVFVGR